MKIVVDSREPEEIAEALARMPPIEMAGHDKVVVEVEVQQIPYGDYLADGMVISRKTISDFITSLNSGHLEEEMHKILSAVNPAEIEVWLLLEADESAWGLGWEALFGCGKEGLACGRFNGVVALLQRMGVGLLFSPGKEKTPWVLVREAHRISEQSAFMHRHIRVEHKYVENPQVAALLDIWPRLPEAVAGTLVETYGSVWAVLNTAEDVLKAHPGVGPGLLKGLNERLGRNGEKGNVADGRRGGHRGARRVSRAG